MNSFFHILKFEWKQLWRSSVLRALILIVFGAGIYGIYFGKFEIEKQNDRIQEVKVYERTQFDSLLLWSSLDTSIVANKAKYEQALSPTGKGWKKHFTFYMVNKASDVSGLCLGQRDLFPVYYAINVGDLARQMNTGELANPMKLFSGNFDLSYVFVFLFPLLVIALLYNLYAGEQEGGTLSLLQSQSTPVNLILISKGLLRMSIIGGISFLLLVLAFVIQGISFVDNGDTFLYWISIVFGYCLFWAIVMGGVIWLRKSSSMSAILGLGIWLLLTIVTPALINIFVSAKVPSPERSELKHTIRTLNNEIWEKPKSFVWEQYYKDNPKHKDGDTTNFKKWYYASFTLLDKEVEVLNDSFEKQIREQNSLLNQWSWLAPAALVHETLSSLSRTDRQSHLDFLEEVKVNHQQLKEIYYDHIFSDKFFSTEDLKKLEKNLNVL